MKIPHRATAACAAITIPAPGLATAAPTNPASFAQNRLWDAGPDILALQQFLNSNGFVLAPSGTGSPGHETAVFGPRTYQALEQLQAAHGLPATGFLGPLTRAAITVIATANIISDPANAVINHHCHLRRSRQRQAKRRPHQRRRRLQPPPQNLPSHPPAPRLRTEATHFYRRQSTRRPDATTSRPCFLRREGRAF
jgi:peptidoglycan hydrolase-like protein with peptidoglycan-binding domain